MDLDEPRSLASTCRRKLSVSILFIARTSITLVNVNKKEIDRNIYIYQDSQPYTLDAQSDEVIATRPNSFETSLL